MTTTPETDVDDIRIALLTDYDRRDVRADTTTAAVLRDGGQFEVWIADDLFETASDLQTALTGATLVLFEDDRLTGHGTVTTVSTEERDGELGLAVDDPLYAGPSDLPDGMTVPTPGGE